MITQLGSLETKINNIESFQTSKKLEKQIEDVVDRRLAEVFDERDEIDKRKRNVVVFGLPESGGSSEVDKLKNDVARVKLLIQNMDPDLRGIRVYDPVRLQTKKNDKPRLLKFKVESEGIKERIVKGSIKANKTVDPSERIYFNNDFTPKQREQHNNLKTKLEQKKAETGEDDWIIWKGDIVKMTETQKKNRDQTRKEQNQQQGQNGNSGQLGNGQRRGLNQNQGNISSHHNSTSPRQNAKGAGAGGR